MSTTARVAAVIPPRRERRGPLCHGGWWRPLIREKRCRLTGAMVVLVAGFSRAAFAEGAGPQVRAFLTTLGFSEAQSVSVQAGRVAVRVLKDAEDSQVTVAGAVHVRAPMQRLLGETSELWALMAVGDRLRTGSFTDPPRLEDLEALVFDPRDLEGVPGCEPRDCSLKLDAAGMRIVKRVSWRAPGAYARFGALLKEWMLGAVEAYRRDGELPVYLDKRRPMSVAEAMNRSVSESPYIDARSPFLEYVLGYPGSHLRDSHDLFYWSTEKLRKPVTSLHHLVVHRGPQGGGFRYVVADKHISDTHYFRSRLELLWLLEGAGPSDFYCVRLSLARVDPPRWLSHMLMGRVRRATGTALEAGLDQARRRLETSGGTTGGLPSLPP